MAEKQFHKGWLYERDGVKFAPYTLKENIVDRAGNTGWADEVDTKLTELEDTLVNTGDSNSAQFTELEKRTKTLEIRTQYLNAEASDVFYITDSNGNIGLKVDNNGTTSYNFITNKTNLNSLAEKTEEIEDTISSIQGESLVNLQDQIIALQKRTKYMDASQDSSAFYITDGKGNIAAIINGSGVTSFNFISKGVTDLNSLYRELQDQGILIEEIQDTLVNMNSAIDSLADRAVALEERTQYMNASEVADTFYVTDKLGNVILKVDADGVHSIEFTAEGLQLKATIEALLARDTSIADALSEVTDRTAVLELKTKFLNASAEDNTFYITDKDGNIGFFVDNDGATSIDFTTSTGIKLSTVKANLDIEIQERKDAIDLLEKADDELSDSITNVNTSLTEKIDNVNTNLTNLIGTTKEELQKEIDDTESAINETINNLATELRNKDTELSDSIVSTKNELTNLVSTTKNELQTNINTVNINLTNSIEETKSELEQSINELGAHVNEKDNELADNLGAVTTRVATLETRTQYMDASADASFYITDEEGNVGFEVNNDGATSIDFTTSTGIKLSQVKANLDTEIQNRKDADAALTAKDNELSDAITNLDNTLNDKIDTTKSDLTTLIGNTKTELQTNIDNTKSELNTTISNLATELRNKDTELSDRIGENATQIEGLKNRMDVAEDDIDNLEANSATKAELAENVEAITDRLDGHDEAIESINEINVQQNDALSDLTPRMIAVETRTKYMDASAPDAFYITDEQGYPGFIFDTEGVLALQYRMKTTANTILPLIGYDKTGTITI